MHQHWIHKNVEEERIPDNIAIHFALGPFLHSNEQFLIKNKKKKTRISSKRKREKKNCQQYLILTLTCDF